MNLELPAPLMRYFAATNRHDASSLTADLTEDAVVHDEGREHHGVPAIRAWASDTFRKYNFTVQPTSAERTHERVAVQVEVAGAFPGSPIALTYRFELAGQRIARVEIG
jgi:ketosteroid isomerase-like protein